MRRSLIGDSPSMACAEPKLSARAHRALRAILFFMFLSLISAAAAEFVADVKRAEAVAPALPLAGRVAFHVAGGLVAGVKVERAVAVGPDMHRSLLAGVRTAAGLGIDIHHRPHFVRALGVGGRGQVG